MILQMRDLLKREQKLLWVGFFLAGLAFGSLAVADESSEIPPVRFDPVVKDVEGWSVFVEPVLLEGEKAEEGALALKMLANHLQRISILVPEGPLKKMKQVGIWLEYDHPRIGGMSYHPSKGWLLANRHDPRLAKKVHIARANQLLSRLENLTRMVRKPVAMLRDGFRVFSFHTRHSHLSGAKDVQFSISRSDSDRQPRTAKSRLSCVVATTNHLCRIASLWPISFTGKMKKMDLSCLWSVIETVKW